MLDKADISLNTIVKSIAYREGAEGKVALDLHNGTREEFDDVVVTAPLGWLQKNKTKAFDPPLPASLAAAIDAISYGCLEKVMNDPAMTFPIS